MVKRRRFGQIRKLPSGKYQASFISPTGRRVNAPSTSRRRAPGPALRPFALEGARVGAYLAGPPAKAPAGDLNRNREPRAAGQLVGGGPAKVEQHADVRDADQPVRARPPFRAASGSRAAEPSGSGKVMALTLGGAEETTNNTVR
jgi:hypothetical protein